MKPTKANLTIYQGATFRWPFYWYSETEVSKTISAVDTTYPTLLTVTSHGLPTSDVPVAIFGVASWINSKSTALADRIYATKVDANTVSVKVNGIGQEEYSGTEGRLVYNSPVNLSSGWVARMHIRESVDAATVIQEFTDTDGQITLGSDGLVELVLTEAETDLLDFSSGVYDLELESGAGEVVRIAEGKVTLKKQVTHD